MKKRIAPVSVYSKPPTAMDEYLPEEEDEAPAPVSPSAPSAAPTPPAPAAATETAEPETLDDDFTVRESPAPAPAPPRRAVATKPRTPHTEEGLPPEDTVMSTVYLGPTERRLLMMEKMRRMERPKSERPSPERVTMSALIREAVRRCYGDLDDSRRRR